MIQYIESLIASIEERKKMILATYSHESARAKILELDHLLIKLNTDLLDLKLEKIN